MAPNAVYNAAIASNPAPIAPSIGNGPEVIVSTPPVLLELADEGVAVTVTVPGIVSVFCFKEVTSTAE